MTLEPSSATGFALALTAAGLAAACIFSSPAPVANESNATVTSTTSSDGATSTSASTSTSAAATTGTTASATASNGATGTGGTGGGMFPPVELPVPPGAGGVPRPAGEPGGVVALDWAGFTGAVSYTFDDSNSSQIDNYEALQALGVRMTFYLQTDKNQASSPTWAQAVTDGHELGNHTHSHAMTDDGADTDEATRFIESTFGVTPLTMAAPYGADGYRAVASTRFLINRGVRNGLVKPNDNTDPFSLFCYIPAENAAAAAFNAEVDAARSGGGWHVVLVHGFTGGSDSAYQPVALEEFVAAVEYAKSLGDMWIDSVLNIGAYWLGQKAFDSANYQVEPSGAVTYTWTLPNHFPSGRSLRVTASGGTLSQAGSELSWNELGYYEVSLDARSLTVTP